MDVDTLKQVLLDALGTRYLLLENYIDAHPYSEQSDRLCSQLIELEKITHAIETECLEKLNHI